MWRPSFLVAVMLLSSAYSAPQELISFKDGKIGVNFGGYHAGVGLGGVVGGSGGAGGGLFAEAGTPHGQAARAGLGGAVDGAGQNAGGLYAGATAGGNVRADAGLSGGVSGGKSAGVGYAAARAGDHAAAAAGLGGEASAAGSTGYKFAETETGPGLEVEVEKTQLVQPIEIVPKVHKKVHKEFKFETDNELKPAQAEASSAVEAGINVKTNVQPLNIQPPTPVEVTEVLSPAPAPVFVEKRIRYKPRHHHRKHAYIGGYIGSPPIGYNYKTVEVSPPVVYKTVEVSPPVIQKRIDVQTYAGHDAAADASAHVGGGADVAYRKQVTFQRNPTFFADIFNIPIQTLKAVGGFLSNSAAGTSVSVQKSATIGAEPEFISSKHAPVLSSSSSSGGGEISIKTPTASKFIDDIFAIPINTLGAVNKFLENNVQRKQVIQEGESQQQHLVGPHARRRRDRQVVIVKERDE